VETKAMHNQLYEDYRAIRLEWEQTLDDLAEQLSALDDARRRLAEAEETLDLYEHATIMGETHDEGRISGSYAEKHKRQVALLLADLREQDPHCKAFAADVEKTEIRVDELECDIEMLRQKISCLRNQARMVSGLAYALAG
jgi:prefoldin subunit 5